MDSDLCIFELRGGAANEVLKFAESGYCHFNLSAPGETKCCGGRLLGRQIRDDSRLMDHQRRVWIPCQGQGKRMFSIAPGTTWGHNILPDGVSSLLTRQDLKCREGI